MNSIFDLATSDAMAAYYNTIASNQMPFLGEALFPARKKLGLKLEWIKGYNSLPIALKPSAFDAKPLLRDRGEASLETTRMPFFREAMRLGEEDRQELLMFQESNNSQYAATVIQKIFDDAAALIDGARAVPEFMAMRLLSNAAIDITSANDAVAAGYLYDYDPDKEWATNNVITLTGTDRWNKPEATPLDDIEEIKRKAAAAGNTLTNAIIGAEEFANLVSNAQIIKAIYPLRDVVGATNGLSDRQVIDFLYNQTGIRFTVNSKMFSGQKKNAVPYFPQKGVVSFFGDGALGNMWYGTTPEEADLMSGNTDASVSIVNTGVAVLTKKESLPVNLITSVSQIVLPSYEGMNTVYDIKYNPDDD